MTILNEKSIVADTNLLAWTLLYVISLPFIIC